MKPNYHWSIIIFVSLFFIFTLQAQPDNRHLGGIVMPPPNAAALGKYGDIPISHFVGLPSIDIPIYNVQQGRISLPISISYHNSGIRVGEPSSWVGTGWSLNAGGAIFRQVNGLSDEKMAHNGYFHGGAYLTGSGAEMLNVQSGLQDSEPDVFTYNFAGYSGKFISTGQGGGTFYTIDENDLSILWLDNNHFLITTPDGMRYHFGTIDGRQAFDEMANSTDIPIALDEEGETQKRSKEKTERSNSFPNSYVSAWYLLKIETHDKEHEINLYYEHDRYQYPQRISDVFEYRRVTNSTDCMGLSSGVVSNDNGLLKEYAVDGYRLDYIQTNTHTIDFISTTPREDLREHFTYPGEQTTCLDVIKISQQGYCKEFQFDYDYLQDSTWTNDPNKYHYKRLMLNSVQEISCTFPYVDKPAYEFSYYDNFSPSGNIPTPTDRIHFPNMLSKSIDHWGYYNGKDNSASNLLIPPTEVVYDGQTFIEGTADRDIDPNLVKQGSLQKITYPTGGYTEFTMEAHEGFYPPSYDRLTVFYMDNCTASDIDCCNTASSTTATHYMDEFELEYGIFDLQINPWSATQCDNSNFSGSTPYVRLTLVDGNGVFYSAQFTSNQTIYFADLIECHNLSPGTYTIILESFEAVGSLEFTSIENQPVNQLVGGLRLQKILHHDGLDSANDIIKTYEYNDAADPSRSSGVLYAPPQYYGTYSDIGLGSEYYYFLRMGGDAISPLSNFDGRHIGYSNVIEYHNGNGHRQFEYRAEKKVPDVTFPYAPIEASKDNGRILTEKTYKQGGTLVAQQTNSYIKDSRTKRKLPLPAYRFFREFSCDNSLFVSKNYELYQIWNRVGSKISMLDGVSTSTSYEYDTNADHTQLVKETMTNSDGSVYETEYQYIYDFGGSLYDTMQVRNQLLDPIEVSQKVDAVLVNSIKNNFSAYLGGLPVSLVGTNTPIYLHQIENYELTWDASGAPSSSWDTLVTFNQYTQDGYPTIMTHNHWQPESLTWDNGLLSSRSYLNHTTNYTYFPNTRLMSKMTDIDGQEVDYRYDKLCRLDSIIERQGNVKTNFTYQYRIGATAINAVKTKVEFSSVANSDLDEISTSEYLDGLGRTKQTVQKQHYIDPTTGNSFDVADFIEYDNQGRISKVYERKNTGGQGGFYHDNFVSGIDDFTQRAYFSSPLNRDSSITPPSWYPTLYSYGANPVMSSPVNTMYPSGSLFQNTIEDPNGNKQVTYTDKLGRKVMSKRSDNGNTIAAQTYFEYDDKDGCIPNYHIYPVLANFLDLDRKV